jgi:uncharacterized membrane protein YtjA (UPF0391 family)
LLAPASRLRIDWGSTQERRCENTRCKLAGGEMRYWASGLLLVAIVAAIFGYVRRYGDNYGGVAWIAAVSPKIVLLIFLVLFVLTLAKHVARSTS